MRDVLPGLADNPALPDHLFERLLATGHEDVPFFLAHRSDLTATQVRTLLAHTDEEIDRLVSEGKVPWADVPRDNPQALLAAVRTGIAPRAVAQQFAVHPDPEIRRSLANHAELLPPDVVAVLARDPDPEVVQRVALYAVDLPAPLAHELARHPHTVVRAELASNEHAPPALLASLLADGGRPAPTRCGSCHRRAEGCADHAPGIRRIRIAAASNPAVPPAGLEEFLDAEEAWAAAEIAERTDLPAHFHPRLAAHPVAYVRMAAAGNPAVGEALLRRLADDPDPAVRAAVAENPAVPLARLTALAAERRLPRDPLPRVLAATEAELRALAGSRVAQVRALVAARPDLPADLLDLLAGDPDPGVARRIAPHPSLPARRLTELAERHGPPLHGAVARNPACPAALLRRMALHAVSSPRALASIAAHPATPAEIVEDLLTHPVRDIAVTAAAHPSLPVETMERLVEQALAGRETS
ncbi:hypothetical protein M5362_30220 [Streptomyces sp. Je 1-79]|uniref:hypothetical protein n=1 Tax=Streptomyces sp. Je 1-79 TaxID=2943847 RepID=UPI0021A592A6|nr:hypothetical protein [Streptomyces sp. Je 1-79]MCT4357383.1 hypothetical protein [Streptomyces sp. Je 1-79]